MRILPVIFLAACISDATQIPIKCGPTDPCPEGQQCGAAGLCVAPDQPSVDDMAMSSDGASNVDQAMMPASGCTRGTATNLGRAWACRTTYNKAMMMTASSVCAQGFHVCRDNTDIGATSLTACANLDGLYAASYIGSRNEFQMPGAATCGQGEIYKVIFGCGKGGVAATTSCAGLSRVIDCATNTGYTCAGMIDGVDNRAATDGVLCCPN